MQKRKFKNSKKDTTPATRADVKEIVTEIVEKSIISLVPPIIENKINKLVPVMIDTGIENFAVMIKRSFDDVYLRFDAIDGRLNELMFFKNNAEKSFYNLQTDFTDLKTRIVNVETRLERIEPKLDAIAIMQIQ